MLRMLTIAAAALALTSAARAQEATPDLLNAALQAAVAQRNDAANGEVRARADLAMARREIEGLRKQIDEARKLAEPAK